MSESATHCPSADHSNGNDGKTTRTRQFQVSRNRNQARHRVRYIESGGAAVNTGECPLCPGEANEQS